MSFTYFLKVDGISGESTNPVHKGEIQVFSFSFGVSNPAPEGGSGGGTGKPNFSDFSIMKNADKASPLLLRAAALGSVIKTATLSSQRSGSPATFSPYTIAFTNVVVDSVQESASSEVPTESVSLRYQSITVTDTPIGSNGLPGTPVSFTYNVVTETGG